MSNAKHTPGPWLAMPRELTNGHIRIRGGALGQRYRIANVLNEQGSAGMAEQEANSRLIAAAPEMFATLERIADHLARHGTVMDDELVCLARAAIAKATGTC